MSMNRLAKKFMTGVLTASMVGAFMAVPTFADELDTSISVTGAVSGDSAAYYQILKRNETSGEWELTDDMKDVTIDGESLKAADIVEGIDDGELHAITAALSGSGTSMILDGTTFKADNVAAGTYVVIITPGSNNSGVVYNPVVVSADYDSTNNSNTSAVKKTDVTVEKKAGDTTDDKKDVNVGDIIPFEITPVVPLFPKNYTNPVYKVTDTLSAGLEIKDSDGDGNLDDEITVAGVGDEYYTVNAAKDGFTVEFNSTYLKNLTTAPTVTITYNAVVTSDATYSVNRMTNTATINFSNSPDDETGNGTNEDKTNHYTFTIDGNLGGEYSADEQTVNKELIKTAVDKNGNPIVTEDNKYTYAGSKTEVSPLAGATFKLTGENLGEDGKTMTTGADGNIKFEGLDAGTYTLKETSAPSGYVVDSTEHTVVISATYKTGSDELESYSIAIDGKTTATFSVQNESNGTVTILKEGTTIYTSLINNTKATGLPSTGGMGTTVFYVVGIILIAGASILLVTKRRMSAK